MKVIKKILFIILLSLTLIISGLGIKFWPIDSRFSGKFQSNAEDTMEYISSEKGLSDSKLKIISQLYGYLYYEIDGHKGKLIQKEHTVQNYPKESSLTFDSEVTEFFLIMKESNKNYAEFIVLPKKFWQLDQISIIEIEFTNDGFWLRNLSPTSFFDWKEKFTKI